MERKEKLFLRSFLGTIIAIAAIIIALQQSVIPANSAVLVYIILVGIGFFAITFGAFVWIRSEPKEMRKKIWKFSIVHAANIVFLLLCLFGLYFLDLSYQKTESFHPETVANYQLLAWSVIMGLLATIMCLIIFPPHQVTMEERKRSEQLFEEEMRKMREDSERKIAEMGSKYDTNNLTS